MLPDGCGQREVRLKNAFGIDGEQCAELNGKTRFRVKYHNNYYKNVSKVLKITMEKNDCRCYNQMRIFDTKRY